MNTLGQNLSNISWRSVRLWQRDLEVLQSGWMIKLMPPILEPILYVLAFGFGMGSLVGKVTYQNETIPYLDFMVPGVLAITVMFWSYFETTYTTFIQMEYQKTFDSILTTPLLVEDIIAGEWLWGATKSLIASTLMLGTVSLMGLVHWPSALLVIPIAALGGLLFSAVGLITTAVCPTIDMFNVPIFVIIFPMFLFSGTFFPLEVLPNWAVAIAYSLPLTHVSVLIRGASLGTLPVHWIWNVTYLIIATATVSVLAIRLMYRRMVK